MEVEKDDMYDFSHARRGYMVVVVNENFAGDEQCRRDGARQDLKYIRAVADTLGLTILNPDCAVDLDKDTTMAVLRRAQATDHSDSDCFALVISTHGQQQLNARLGGRLDNALVCSDQQLVFTRDVVNMFNDRNCPSLAEKPKLFFIQACRGHNVDHGSEVQVLYPTPREIGRDVIDDVSNGNDDEFSMTKEDRSDQLVAKQQTTLGTIKEHHDELPMAASDHKQVQYTLKSQEISKIITEKASTIATCASIIDKQRGENSVQNSLNVENTVYSEQLQTYDTSVLRTLQDRNNHLSTANVAQTHTNETEAASHGQQQANNTSNIDTNNNPVHNVSDQPARIPVSIKVGDRDEDSEVPESGGLVQLGDQTVTCTGDLTDKTTLGSKIKQLITKPFTKKKSSSHDHARDKCSDDVTCCDNDMLVVYAVPDGMYAFRNRETGSWMIYSLWLVLQGHALRGVSFLTLMTRMAAVIAERETSTAEEDTNRKKAVAVLQHRLTRDIVFNRK